MDLSNEFGEEEVCTRLKSALDINDLRNPEGKGVTFEFDEDSYNANQEEPETNIIKTFGKDSVAANLCLMSDEEDEEEDEDEDEKGSYTATERFEKRLKKVDGSDITPDKDGGILKQRKTLGVGSVITEGSLVKFHYNAYTDIGEAPFDSSRLREKEYKVRLGKGETILGLELALRSMRKHEFSRFLIKPEYAYGGLGVPPRIPPSATLIFDVEVLHFIEQDGVDDYYSMTVEERKAKLKYADIEKVVKAENSEAKEYFAAKQYHKAFGKYKRSAGILENYNLKNQEEEDQWSRQLVKVYINAAICCHKVKHFGRCISFCNQAMNLDKTNIKSHYFKGKALYGLGKFDDAKHCLLRARSLDPSNTEVSKAMDALSKSIKEHELFEKDMYKKMFSSPSAGAYSTSSSTEKSKEDEETGVSSGNYGRCSDGFRAIVKEQFEKFQQDPSMTELPFPQMPMSEAEIECILSTAADLGMNVKSRGTGSSIRYEVHKATTS